MAEDKSKFSLHWLANFGETMRSHATKPFRNGMYCICLNTVDLASLVSDAKEKNVEIDIRGEDCYSDNDSIAIKQAKKRLGDNAIFFGIVDDFLIFKQIK